MARQVRVDRVAGDQGWMVTAFAGAWMIAACYGFARFAFGLFAPRFSESFGLEHTGVGLLAGVSTAGFALGLVVAPGLAARAPKWTVVLGGATAASGLALTGAAVHLPVLVVGIFIAGFGTGLVSPGIAQLIGRTVEVRWQDRAQGWANTGSGVGHAATAFTPLLAVSWHAVWLGFAVVTAGLTALAARVLPSTTSGIRRATSGTDPWWRLRGAGALLANAFLFGVTSAPYWTFSSTRILEAGLDETGQAWSWFLIGACGPLAGVVGVLVERFGLPATSLGFWVAWTGSLVLLAAPLSGIAQALASAALFGTAYIALSSTYILWSARLNPDHPSQGVTASFISLGIGQALGSSLAGALADRIPLAGVFAVTAVVSLLWLCQLHGRLAPPADGVRLVVNGGV